MEGLTRRWSKPLTGAKTLALICDDIETTVGELSAKGAQFRGPIEQREYGRVIICHLLRAW